MFTGIVEEVGCVESVTRGAEVFQLVIAAERILTDVKLGDSIAVNGVCLTVTDYSRERFSADVMPETVRATSLAQLARGSKVNLERAMAVGDRFGGHLVSGHVDGIGQITKIKPYSNAVYFHIKTPEALMKYIVPKGSIAVDGISLTVVDVTEDQFSISCIPHTFAVTTLHAKQVGDVVNLECDMVAKYIERLLLWQGDRSEEKSADKPGLTKEILEQHGFL